MEGTGANLRLPLNPPFFFESAVNYDVTTGPGTLTTGFAELRPLDQPSGQVRAWDPNLRPQFTQQWNVFVEYLLTDSMSANVGYVGHKADAPGDAGGGQPAVAGRWRSGHLGADEHPPAALRHGAADHEHLDDRGARPERLQGPSTQPAAAQRRGFEYLAWSTLSETKTNNLGYYGSGGVAAEGAYWMNTYEPEWNYGPAFFDARHNFVISANYEMPYGRGRTYGSDASWLVDAFLGGWRLSGIFQARSGFPITVTDGAPGRCRVSAATSGRTASATRFRATRTSLTGWTSTRSRGVPLGHVGQLRHRRRPRPRLPEHRRRAGQAVPRRRRRATSSSGSRRST